MKTLADECLALIGPKPVSARDLAARLGADIASVRAAIKALDSDGRARLVRGGRGRGGAVHVVAAAGGDLRVCAHCRRAFAARTKRVTCSRQCAVALGWAKLSPEALARRRANLSAAQSTPEALARTAAHNERRWARASEREKLRAQNKREWADPYKKAARSVAIANVQRRPEMRALYSENLRARMADPEYRERSLAASRKAKRTPEYRALFSEKMRARWRDPVMRAKYTANNQRSNDKKRAKAAARREALRQSAETAEAVRLYTGGGSLAECASALGVSTGTVVFRLKLAGVARRPCHAGLKPRKAKGGAP